MNAVVILSAWLVVVVLACLVVHEARVVWREQRLSRMTCAYGDALDSVRSVAPPTQNPTDTP